VARRSGFSPAALRYYQERGLLPETERTDAGYRVNDDRTLERLAFVARAKSLGCTLEEIADLSLAWDGGECGPLQDRLRATVDAKIADAQARIAELMTLTAELQDARASLKRHRPDGPCDDACGCSIVHSPTGPTGVSLLPTSSTVPIACTLDDGSVETRLEEWQALTGTATDAVGSSMRTAIEGGVRLEFPPGVDVAELARLVAAEQGCCRFLSFAITVDERGVGLEVRSHDGAQDVVHALFGGPA